MKSTDSIESRLGTLELENGYPTAATVEKPFDDIDYQRACQAYLWALPLMAMQQWQNEHVTKFGAGKCDYVDYLTFPDKLGLLTANATQFWSFTVYDNETRCFVDTGVTPDRSSRDNIVTNADGSVDLCFGPDAPAGQPESNWIKTLPKKGWFTYFRLYGPTQAYFDRSWVLPDIEVVA
jgi:hypothetical protein